MNGYEQIRISILKKTCFRYQSGSVTVSGPDMLHNTIGSTQIQPNDKLHLLIPGHGSDCNSKTAPDTTGIGNFHFIYIINFCLFTFFVVKF